MNSSTGFASLLKKRGMGEKEGEKKKSRPYLYVKIHYLHVIEIKLSNKDRTRSILRDERDSLNLDYCKST